MFTVSVNCVIGARTLCVCYCFSTKKEVTKKLHGTYLLSGELVVVQVAETVVVSSIGIVRRIHARTVAVLAVPSKVDALVVGAQRVHAARGLVQLRGQQVRHRAHHVCARQHGGAVRRGRVRAVAVAMGLVVVGGGGRDVGALGLVVARLDALVELHEAQLALA